MRKQVMETDFLARVIKAGLTQDKYLLLCNYELWSQGPGDEGSLALGATTFPLECLPPLEEATKNWTEHFLKNFFIAENFKHLQKCKE